MGHERRVDPRYTVNFSVVCGESEGFHSGEVRDLSMGGAKVYTPDIVPLGTELTLTPVSEAHELLTEIPAHVVRVIAAAGPGRATCLGVRFDRLEIAQRDALRELMDQRAALDAADSVDDPELFVADPGASASHFRLHALIHQHGRRGPFAA